MVNLFSFGVIAHSGYGNKRDEHKKNKEEQGNGEHVEW
jgi:hypothetical protein